jgi:hypothetical protein
MAAKLAKRRGTVAAPAFHEELDSLQKQNAKLYTALETASAEMELLRKTIASLEGLHEELAEAEGRAQAAEDEREMLVAQRTALTPRPVRSLDPGLMSVLHGDGMRAGQLVEWVKGQPEVEASQLAVFLTTTPVVNVPMPAGNRDSVGDSQPENESVPTEEKDEVDDGDWKDEGGGAAGQSIKTQTDQSGVAPVALSPTAATPSNAQQQSPLPSPPPIQLLPAWQISGAAFQGCLAPSPPAAVARAIDRLRLSTAAAYARLESELAAALVQRDKLQGEVSTHHAAAAKAEAARRRREEEAALEKKNPVQEYLDLLTSQGEWEILFSVCWV